MNRDEAKKILALYRPGMPNDADPQMTAALELAQRDPELAVWFQNHCAIFETIRGKLKSVPVPQGLRRQIIAEHVTNTRVLPLTSRLLLVTAIAALVLLTASVWFKFAPNSESSFQRYRNRMAAMVQRGYFMPMTATNQAAIREYFGSQGAPSDFVLSRSLEQLPGEGGVVLPWNNHKVSLLCLNAARRPGEKNDLYLFMASRSVLTDAPASGQPPEFKRVKQLMTMTWAVGDRVYLLAGSGDEAALQKYLE